MVTRASWVLAKGNPEHIPKESVILHAPLVENNKFVFVYAYHFHSREGNLVETESLKDFSKLPENKLKLRKSSVSAVGERGHSIVTLSACGGVDALRSWIGESRRIVNASGSKAWWLTQPIF